jgi:hypothetical protein|tara:strand:+ start:470 stop:1273 length:804 start_codon:yes stop_codon:yes gene_type:complete
MKHKRRGQSLVEFALVALVVYMLLAALLTFGHMLFVAQGTQQVADLMAHEISRIPLPADDTFEDTLDNGSIDDIFQKRYLVIDFPPGTTFEDLAANLPIVNQQLLPLMVVDEIDGNRVLRYPGAVIDQNGVRTVMIPLVTGRDDDGVETIEFVSVVEEINSDEEPFQLSSTQRGIVALRINYPYQSASMSSFRSRQFGDSQLGQPNIANDASVIAGNVDGSLVASDIPTGPNSGDYGLGMQFAFGQSVRPYRRVISAQAIYRRETFQ